MRILNFAPMPCHADGARDAATFYSANLLYSAFHGIKFDFMANTWLEFSSCVIENQIILLKQQSRAKIDIKYYFQLSKLIHILHNNWFHLKLISIEIMHAITVNQMNGWTKIKTRTFEKKIIK